MERRDMPTMPMSEQSYVDNMLNELVSLVPKTQPSQSYQGDWFQAVEVSNSILRMEQIYAEARRQGFQWAEVLAPSKLFSIVPLPGHIVSSIQFDNCPVNGVWQIDVINSPVAAQTCSQEIE